MRSRSGPPVQPAGEGAMRLVMVPSMFGILANEIFFRVSRPSFFTG